MPYIQWIGSGGNAWVINSSDPDIIAAWLYEQARKAGSVNATYADNRIVIQPIPLVQDSFGSWEYDWPIMGHKNKSQEEYTLQAQKLVGLANAIQKFMTTFQVRKETEMAGSEWCDFGNHAFKAGAKGTIRMVQQGDEEDRVICPECGAAMGLNTEYTAPEKPSERKAALEAAAKIK